LVKRKYNQERETVSNDEYTELESLPESVSWFCASIRVQQPRHGIRISPEFSANTNGLRKYNVLFQWHFHCFWRNESPSRQNHTTLKTTTLKTKTVNHGKNDDNEKKTKSFKTTTKIQDASSHDVAWW
jgi:hypothetical protein